MGEMAKYAIKVAIAVLTGTALLTAILAIIGVVSSGLSSVAVLREALSIVGIFMPFNAGTVFAVTATSGAALLSFITARKVYEVMTNFAQSTD